MNEKEITDAIVISEDQKKKDLTIKNNEVLNPQALISQAIQNNTPIETMERLLLMRKELKAEKARDEFFKDLSRFQSECPVIEKRNPVYDKNGKLRYKFAPLDDIVSQVKPLLLKYGFAYIIETIQDKDSVGAICKVFHQLGHSEKSEFRVPIDMSAYMNIAQKVASALTFAKRYAFCDALGIMTGIGDDDGNSSGEPTTKTLGLLDSLNNSVNKNQNQRPINNSKIDFNTAPEENKGLYTAIMALIRETNNGKALFTVKEKAENKKKADAVIGVFENLKELYKIINKVAQERRQKAK